MPSTEVTLAGGQIIHGAQDILKLKEEEIAQGKRVIADLERIPNVSKSKLSRIKGRVRFLERFVNLIKQGFIPIPRMAYTDVAPIAYPREADGGWRAVLTFDSLPVEAIEAISTYKPIFTRIGIIPARKTARRRDPILIGVLQYGKLEEHFLLAWWRPDLMKPIDLW